MPFRSSNKKLNYKSALSYISSLRGGTVKEKIKKNYLLNTNKENTDRYLELITTPNQINNERKKIKLLNVVNNLSLKLNIIGENYLNEVGYLRVLLFGNTINTDNNNFFQDWQNQAENHNSELYPLFRGEAPKKITLNGNEGLQFPRGITSTISNGERILSRSGATGSTIIMLITKDSDGDNNFLIDQGKNANKQQAIRKAKTDSFVINDGTDFSSDPYTSLSATDQISYIAVARWNFNDQTRSAILIGDEGIIASQTESSPITEFNTTNVADDGLQVAIGGQSKSYSADDRQWKGIVWATLWYDDFVNNNDLLIIKTILQNKFGTVSNLSLPESNLAKDLKAITTDWALILVCNYDSVFVDQNNVVQSWHDESGNGYEATYNNGIPTYNSSLNCIEFRYNNTTNSSLNLPDDIDPDLGYSLFTVIEALSGHVNNMDRWGRLFSSWDGSSDEDYQGNNTTIIPWGEYLTETKPKQLYERHTTNNYIKGTIKFGKRAGSYSPYWAGNCYCIAILNREGTSQEKTDIQNVINSYYGF